MPSACLNARPNRRPFGSAMAAGTAVRCTTLATSICALSRALSRRIVRIRSSARARKKKSRGGRPRLDDLGTAACGLARLRRLLDRVGFGRLDVRLLGLRQLDFGGHAADLDAEGAL